MKKIKRKSILCGWTEKRKKKKEETKMDVHENRKRKRVS
jgi:hypothetical protein